jgi:acid phosphatase type 7
MYRSLGSLGLLALLAGGATSLPARGARSIPPPIPRLHLAADAHVTRSAPRRNFGHLKYLRLGPESRVYIRSDLAEAPLTKAGLFLWVESTVPGLTVRVVKPKWGESKVTFANAPPPTGPAIHTGRLLAKRWAGIEITRLVRGKRSFNLVLTASRGAFASREAGDAAPTATYQAAWPELAAAGEIGDCDSPFDSITADALNWNRPRIAALGDLVAENGSLDEFNSCYGSSWGPLKPLTKPTPGDNEYKTPGAAGYFGYWGSRAGTRGRGWYSYDVGTWHVISLNSNCREVGGCRAGSPQGRWLRRDLAAHKTRCTLAFWHHPRFSGGHVTNDDEMEPFWQVLYDNGADVVLSAHARNYQRFAPQTPTGVADPGRGIREFVVGTGGDNTLDPVAAIANTEAMQSTTWGVLYLTLRATDYRWFFDPVPYGGGSFVDYGAGACH